MSSTIPIVRPVDVPAITPVRNWLLVEIQPADRMIGNIHVPESAKVEKPFFEAKVIRVGPGLKDSNGKPAGCSCEADQMVVLVPKGPQMIPVDGGVRLLSMTVAGTVPRYFLIPDELVIGVFDA